MTAEELPPEKATPLIIRLGEATAFLGRSRAVIITIAVVLTAAIAVLDYTTASGLQLGFLYVVPILYVTWFAGTRAGVAMAVACATLKFTTDLPWFRESMARLSVPFWGAMFRFGASLRRARESMRHASIPFWNAVIHLIGFILIVAIASLRHAFGQQRMLALHDPLTGAANRRLFLEEAERELLRSRRYHRPFTVAFVDLDDFKRLNDTLGHQAGDTFLRLVTEGIRGALRATDISARFGGDEFALLLPETDFSAASVVLSKIHASVTAAGAPLHFVVTASIGAVTFEEPPASVEDMLARTDLLMYSVKKKRGKNAVMIVRSSDLEPAAGPAIDTVPGPTPVQRSTDR